MGQIGWISRVTIVVRVSLSPFADLPFAGGDLDRDAARRADPDALSALFTDASTLVLEMVGDEVPVRRVADGSRLVLRPPRPSDREQLWFYLGRADGEHWIAVCADTAEGVDPELLRGPRQIGQYLTAREGGALATTLALAAWHRGHPRCPRCGAPTRATHGGWIRRCDADGSEHYPRTDPAIIVAITDAQDRLLLARGATWPEDRYSLLAGFVEPGESLAAAVAREVHEESGLVLSDITYVADQPWPFPSSLMVGFTARAVTTELHLDQAEIRAARWVTRDDLTALWASGEIARPNRFSISARLVEQWYGQRL